MADVDDLISAAAAGDLQTLSGALDSGARADGRGANGWTPLIAAARNGQVDCARLLIARGADPNLASPRGTTPLMYAKTHAFASGDFTLMEVLLAAGSAINARDAAGLSVLDYVETRSAALIDWLLARGAGQTDVRER